MNQSIEGESEEDYKILSLRVKHPNWQVRKRAFEAIHESLCQIGSVRQQFKINTQIFTAIKLTAILNNLTEQKHPILILKGLDCVLIIISLNRSSIKYFNQLLSEGLQKFPLLTQQRKAVLQKFMEFLYFFKEDQNIVATLNSKLSLPNEKAVMWAIQVIGALQVTSLKKKLKEISRKHPKKDVKELAAEISEELQQEETLKDKEQETPKGATSRPNIKSPVVPATKRQDPKKMAQLLQKIHHYQQLNSKAQQNFTSELLDYIEPISQLNHSPQLLNFSHFIQLMIQDNNQIISTNGVRMLTVLFKNRSQLIPHSFPLLFLFRKFKLHKTHSTNLNLFKLVEIILCSNRSNDLMAATCEGLGLGENKANLKYGCVATFLRVFCYFYHDRDLFLKFCIGQYDQSVEEKIENRKQVEKMLLKCADVFMREKDRDYQPAIERVKQVLGITRSTGMQQQRSAKKLPGTSQVKSLSRTKASHETASYMKTQPIPKPSSKGSKTNTSTLTLSPEGQLNKILEMTTSQTCSQKMLSKATDKCLQCVATCMKELVYDMFYFCQILDSFIEQYPSNELWDQQISIFLIQYLKVVAQMPIKKEKKNSKIVQNGIQYLFTIAITKLALGKELLTILDSLSSSVDFQVIFKCLGAVLVMKGQSPKNKNKKYLNRWLEENTPEEFINNDYFELREAIEKKKQKKKKETETPPSIINIPTYQQLKKDQIDTFRGKNQNWKAQIKDQVGKQKITPKNYHQEYPQYVEKSIKKLDRPQRLQMFENADISHIEKVEEQQTDRIDEKWEYFLNKKGINVQPDPPIYSCKSPQKYGSDSENDQKMDLSKFQEGINGKAFERNQEQQKGYRDKSLENLSEVNPIEQNKQANVEHSNVSEEEDNRFQEEAYSQQKPKKSPKNFGIKSYQDQQQEQVSEEPLEKLNYIHLDDQRIIYMLQNSGKSFNHLRTLVLSPFKKSQNKHGFLQELTHLIQSQEIKKPEPYKSLLLLVITLFSEIRTDKSIIEPLQFLYEFMAQKCSNNDFLKTIVGLYHCVIEQSEEGDRKLLLTILAKSMIRIMPYVENAVQLLKDFQQFYQIGELVYFQMYEEEYNLIRQVLESSDSLQEVVAKACQEEGEGIMAIVQGWLDTRFKNIVKTQIQQLLAEVQDTNDS